jgi:hypothetical protein
VRKPSLKANASPTSKQDDCRDAETAPCSPYEQLSCLEGLPASPSVRSERRGKSFPREKLQHNSCERVNIERATHEMTAALPVERKQSVERSLPWESLLPSSADSKLLAKKVYIPLLYCSCVCVYEALRMPYNKEEQHSVAYPWMRLKEVQDV